MGRDDWCRRKTWTEKDQAEFFERNRRSRGANSKAQYMRIQAVTLLETRKQDLTRAALELLERSFEDYPDAMDCALAYETAGQCCEALEKKDEAIEYYRRALRRQKEFRGIQTNACFYFGRLVAVHGRTDLFGEVTEALNAFGASVFPWHSYMAKGVRALIAASEGDRGVAITMARDALAASEVRDSGFGWGRDSVGLVKDKKSTFHRRLRNLARSRT